MTTFLMPVLALMLATQSAAVAMPAKLILTTDKSTVAIDYPTWARCLTAAEEITREQRRREERARNDTERVRPGIVIALPISAFCISG